MSQPLKDPFYNQIIAELNGHLNPAVFERCMGDLLRQDFPGLAPVTGGGDSGFDGVIPDDDGAFPLVCTTAENVERNLRRSLDAIRKRGWPDRRVALATSQALTPQRRLALFETAKTKGFLMVQVFDRDALADRLYRSSRWCQELLRLSWTPSPLSSVPATRRPLTSLKPIGREEALSWIRSASSDCVISGEPGSGKTFLLYHLIRQGWPGLFLASSGFDEEKIILAYNQQRPEWIIVDDAHASGHLEKLIHLRGRLGADFKILATTWKGSRDEVLEILGATEGQSFQLELLTRNEIVEVLRGMGVEADDDVLRVMVNQAANKPGLAVTLGSLWLRGEWLEVLDGKALLRELLAFFDRTLKQDAGSVLAAFSLGGDRGMEQDKVREFLELARPTVWKIVTQLAVGGVLAETVMRGAYAVWPRELRFAMLQRAFSPVNAARHDLLRLLDQAPSHPSAVETLVAAQVDLPPGELRKLVSEAGTTDAWQMLAESSEDDARWVLENYPGSPLSIARATLVQAPEATLHLLLDLAASAVAPLHLQSDHPLRIVKDWGRELQIPAEERVSRRKLVARVSGRFLKSGGRRTVGLHGILTALSSGLESHSLDPGLGTRITIFSNTVALEEVTEIKEIWKASRHVISSLEAADWPVLSALLWGWVYPEYSAKGAHLTQRVQRAMRSFARQLLKDLAPLAQASPGLAASFLDLAEEAGLKLKLRRDPVFELLYPHPDASKTSPNAASLALSLKEIAANWKDGACDESARKLAAYEREIRETGRPCWPRRAPDLCKELARIVDNPEAWLDAFLERELPYDLIHPFLERILDDKRDGWDGILSRLLDEERHVVFVLGFLDRSDLPSALTGKALEKADRSPYLIETLCQKGVVPLPIVKALLVHTDRETALAAAVGEWLGDPRGQVKPELQEDWKGAILRAGVEEDENGGGRARSSSYWLEEILLQDRNLAFEWVRDRLRDAQRPRRIGESSLLAKVITALDRGQRVALLDELRQGTIPAGLVGLLVAGDLQVYRSALRIENLGRHRLEPLKTIPGPAWADLAVAAEGAGFEEEEIALASLRGIRGWSGSGLSTFQRWDEAFARIKDDAREVIREIARLGRSEAQRRIRRAEAEERKEALHGI